MSDLPLSPNDAVSASGLSRRALIFTTAAAGAAALSGCASGAPNRFAERDRLIAKRPQNPKQPIKVGLVGCGGRGTGAALQALLAENGSVHLTAVGDTFADRLEGCLGYLGAELARREEATEDRPVLEPGTYTDRLKVAEGRRFVGFQAFQQVIDSGVDVVLLATPPAFRPAHLDYATKAGKHVFCEKPMAIDGPGIRSVIDSAARAKQQGTSLVSGFCWRYNRRHRAFFDQLHNGAIGDLRAVYTTYNTGAIGSHSRQEGWSDIEWQLRNWHHFSWLSGDHIVEQACHSIDKQAWAFEDREPLSVVAVGGCQTRSGPEKGNTYDHFAATFDYGDGVKAFHMARQWANTDGENNDYFYGSKGHGIIENWTPRHEFTGPGAWVYEGEGNDMYQQEHDELFASIRLGKPINDGEWMIKSTQLAVMTRMAAYTGKVVSWDAALNSTERLGPESLAWGDYEYAPEPTPGVTPLV